MNQNSSKRFGCLVLALIMCISILPSRALAATFTQLGNMPVGSIVKVNENGMPVNFIVIQTSYEGNGGTLLLRQKSTAPSVDGAMYNAYMGGSYFESLLDNFTTGSYKNRLDFAIQSALLPVNISSNGETQTRSIFNLSAVELGIPSGATSGGTFIAYFNTAAARIAASDWSSPEMYFTRSDLSSDEGYYVYVNTAGGSSSRKKVQAGMVRPAFVLPDHLLVDENGNVLTNTPPNAPGSITATRSGNNINVSWTTSVDADGNLAGYILERSVNGGAWSVIRNANVISYQDTISEGWTSVQYRVKAYDTPGLESSYTVSSAVAVPYIAGIAAAQPSMLHTGGNNTITVSGVNLPGGISVKVYDGATEILSGSTTGNGTAQSVTLSFPANVSYTQDKPYTIKASWNGGVTWSSFTGSVTVERNKTPIITSVTVAPTSFNHEGGNIEVYTYGYNLFNDMLVAAEAEDEMITGRTTGSDTVQHATIAISDSWDYANPTTYEVRASLDDGDTWFTSPMEVTVAARPVPLPEITLDLPSSLAMVEGDTLTLRVNAQVEDGDLFYHWYKDGAPLEWPDATVYGNESVGLSDAGQYQCIVTNTIQGQTVSANSTACNVTVQKEAEVPNIVLDLPANKEIIEWHELTLSVAAAVPEGNLTFQWYKDDLPLAGETASTLTIPEAALEDVGDYFCRITNTYVLSQKSIDSATCEIGVLENAPQITADLPPAKGLIESLELVLSIAASSPDGALSYAWYKDGTILPGETASVLCIPNAQLSDAGAYHCRVTNSFGAHTRYVDSQTCAVTIEEKPLITKDVPSSMAKVEGDALDLEIEAVAVTGDISYQWYKDSSPLPGETERTLRIPSLVLADAGAYRCRVSLAAHGVTASVDSALCNVSVQKQAEVPTIVLDLPAEMNVFESDTAILSVDATTTDGELTYQWFKDGEPLEERDGSELYIWDAQLNDSGNYFCRLTNTFGLSEKSIDSAICKLTIQDFAPVIEQNIPDEKTVIEMHELKLSVSASAPVGVISYMWYQNGLIIEGAGNSPVMTIQSASLQDAGEYYCEVRSKYKSQRKTTISNVCTITIQQNAPEISEDIPSEMSLIETQELKLSVEASSPDGTVTYQWYKDGQALPEAISSTLQISSVSLTDAGTYFCRVTNSFETTTWSIDSASCTVTILQGPALPVIETDLPENITIASGSSLLLSASASSLHGDVTYQWYKDGAPITSATASSLYYEVASPSSAGQYHCVITSSVEAVKVSASTRVCTVIYEYPPEPQPEPEPTTGGRTETPARPPSTPGIVKDLPDATPVKSGDTVTLTVEVDERYTDRGSTYYQWYKDGELVENANGRELVIDVIDPTTEGLYQLIVTVELHNGEQIIIPSKICAVFEDLSISDEKLQPTQQGGYDVSKGGVITQNGRELQVFVVGGKDTTVTAIMQDRQTLAVEVSASNMAMIGRVLINNEIYNVDTPVAKIPLGAPLSGAVGIFVTNIIVNPPKTGNTGSVSVYIGTTAILVSIVSIVSTSKRKEQ